MKLAAIKFALGDFVNDAHRVFTHHVPNDVNAEVKHISDLPNKPPSTGLHGHDPQRARAHHCCDLTIRETVERLSPTIAAASLGRIGRHGIASAL